MARHVTGQKHLMVVAGERHTTSEAACTSPPTAKLDDGLFDIVGSG